MQYLEETRPQRPLLPQDFHKRAKVREICEVIYLMHFVKSPKSPNSMIAGDCRWNSAPSKLGRSDSRWRREEERVGPALDHSRLSSR